MNDLEEIEDEQVPFQQTTPRPDPIPPPNSLVPPLEPDRTASDPHNPQNPSLPQSPLPQYPPLPSHYAPIEAHFSCHVPNCNNTFPTLELLRRHNETHLPQPDRPHRYRTRGPRAQIAPRPRHPRGDAPFREDFDAYAANMVTDRGGKARGRPRGSHMRSGGGFRSGRGRDGTGDRHAHQENVQWSEPSMTQQHQHHLHREPTHHDQPPNITQHEAVALASLIRSYTLPSTPLAWTATASRPPTHNPFYPDLPWYSVPEEPFAPRAAHRQRRTSGVRSAVPDEVLAFPARGKVTDEKVTDEKVTDEKVTDEKVTDEKVTDEKATDEKATDNKAANEPATAERPSTSYLRRVESTREAGTTPPEIPGPSITHSLQERLIPQPNSSSELRGSRSYQDALVRPVPEISTELQPGRTVDGASTRMSELIEEFGMERAVNIKMWEDCTEE